MIYNTACGEKLSRLGFGAMRLPLNGDRRVDVQQVQQKLLSLQYIRDELDALGIKY